MPTWLWNGTMPSTGSLVMGMGTGIPLTLRPESFSFRLLGMGQPLLQRTNVTKSFGAVRALRGVSFQLQAGDVHALLGENGAGKSTLIKLITGAHQPDSGTIQIGGHPVRHLTPAVAHKLGIACIYQQPALFPDLTVEENIGLRLEPAT